MDTLFDDVLGIELLEGAGVKRPGDVVLGKSLGWMVLGVLVGIGVFSVAVVGKNRAVMKNPSVAKISFRAVCNAMRKSTWWMSPKLTSNTTTEKVIVTLC